MIILSWNCLGFARPAAIRSLRAFCRSNKPDILFLCETKIQLFDSFNPLLTLGFSSFLQVPAAGTKGGLILAWKPGFDLEPILLNPHHISCLIYSDPPSSPWLLSCIHAPSQWNLRSDFWSLLKNTGSRFGGPWLLAGDFNAILAPEEKQGGRDFGSSSHNVFSDFVQVMGLVDLGYNGNPFTWCNKRHGRAKIKERLDHGLSNHDWLLLFPDSIVHHLPATASDHNPIKITTEGNSSPLKPFKFESFWTRDNSSHLVIASAWNQPVIGSTAISLSKKLKYSKSALKKWNVDHFGNIHCRD
jgi:exonuclease III